MAVSTIFLVTIAQAANTSKYKPASDNEGAVLCSFNQYDELMESAYGSVITFGDWAEVGCAGGQTAFGKSRTKCKVKVIPVTHVSLEIVLIANGVVPPTSWSAVVTEAIRMSESQAKQFCGSPGLLLLRATEVPGGSCQQVHSDASLTNSSCRDTTMHYGTDSTMLKASTKDKNAGCVMRGNTLLDNGIVQLILEMDGRLVLRRDTRSLSMGWTALSLGQMACFGNSGNLVLYKSTNQVPEDQMWSTKNPESFNNSNNSGVSLTLQRDCNLVIKNKAGITVWSADSASSCNF